jgi:hypothetical protein
MLSPYLEAERDRLLQLIQVICNCGSAVRINVCAAPPAATIR